MAKRLTEEMVVARTKISDLGKIKRLNCWGSELVDVSLLRRMPCVEVLSLSINKINSLEDFQFCKRLEELYIRQNDIRDLNQICYLQCLPNLKNLWLGENPCASTDGSYRAAVLRALPQLQKLDNVAVSPEELKEAQRKGKPLTHPEDPEPSDEEEVVAFTPPPQVHQYSRYQDYPPEQQQEYSPQRSPSRQEAEVVQYQTEESEEYYARVEIKQEDPPPPYTNNADEIARRPEPARRNYSPEQEYAERRRNSYERESPPQQQYYDRSPPPPNGAEEYNSQADAFRETKIVTSQTANIIKRSPPPANNAEEYNNHADTYRETRIVTSQSANSIKEYTNGERYSQQQVYRQTESESNYPQEATSRRERHACPAPRPPFNRRPVTRNSNILSAVLCLVKELDYPSLEVVEMAVRCRMDELDE